MNTSPHASAQIWHTNALTLTMHDLATGAGTERPLAPDSTKPGGRGKRTT